MFCFFSSFLHSIGYGHIYATHLQCQGLVLSWLSLSPTRPCRVGGEDFCGNDEKPSLGTFTHARPCRARPHAAVTGSKNSSQCVILHQVLGRHRAVCDMEIEERQAAPPRFVACIQLFLHLGLRQPLGECTTDNCRLLPTSSLSLTALQIFRNGTSKGLAEP